jgi:hypothetical protein
MKTSAQIHLLISASLFLATPSFAGEPIAWDKLPKPVQSTVIANGGKPGMDVDFEGKSTDGQPMYEAGIKGPDGQIHDYVITADGKLLTVKSDDASDAASERADRAAALLKNARFSHPRDITNPYLPLATVQQDVLEGTEDSHKTRVERTVKPDIHKTFTLAGQQVEALAFEDRAYEDGQLHEVALDYFAQDDAGNVYYLGEDVDNYKDGKVVSHNGSWLTGKDTPAPGILFPAADTLKIGLIWRSEDVSSDITEKDEIVSLSETVVTPSGTYTNCIKVKETTPDSPPEFKYYAKNVGVVREQPASGDELLISHKSIAPTPKK